MNLGVFSRIVAGKLGINTSEPTIPDCHWRERIGFLIPDRFDKWWEVNDEHQAQQVGAEIVALLDSVGIPALEAVASTRNLRMLWASGRSPGLTDVQRQRYLDRLEEDG